MGSSGALGSVMTMPLELAATARSSRRRISSEAICPGSRSNAAGEDLAFNTPILQPYRPAGCAPAPTNTDVKGSPFRGMYCEENAVHERRAQNGLRAAATALRLRRPGAR